MNPNMIIVYDIADPKRLNKAAKIILDYGKRVQKSKYEVEVNDRLFDELKYRIEDIIKPAEDGVKYIPMCNKCKETIEIIGKGYIIKSNEEYYII